MKQYQTSVVIIGAGPAGLTLAHLLASYNINTILLEQQAQTTDEPRAIGIDSETLRTMQAIDQVDSIKDEVFSHLEITDYVNADSKLLYSFDTRGYKPYGYPLMNTFEQPVVDRILANTLPALEGIELWFNHTLQRFQQNDEGVTVYAENAEGEQITINADYLVGCDGGRSTVRIQLGIEMTGESNEFPWLVIDTVDPGFDNGFGSRFFCDPKRPGMTINTGKQRRRWEWMLMPGETPADLLEDSTIASLIEPYTDPSQVTIRRKRVYNFAAIIAERWQEGRVFLAGDAAHMTPPFAGQGLNSGMRDVRNLSWKLAMVINGLAAPTLLETYVEERWNHAKELIQFALNLGEQIQPIDPQKAAERDAFFFELQKDPKAVEDFANGMAASIRARALDKGIVVGVGEHPLNGQLLYQPKVGQSPEDAVLLDEVLGKGLSILGYNCDPEQELPPQTIALWKNLGATLVSLGDTPAYGYQDQSGTLGEQFPADEKIMVLVRPDKFCLATFTAATADNVLAEAAKLLHLHPRPATDENPNEQV